MGRDGKLLALYGYPGSGKDTVAGYLVERGDWTRVAFADPLREMLLALDPYVTSMVYEDVPDLVYILRLSEYLERENCSIEEAKRALPEVRRLLQRLGTEAGRDILGEDVWVDLAQRRIEEVWSGNVVVTDMRFVNEYRSMVKQGALIAEVRRPGFAAINGHASERHYGEFLPNVVIHNDGSLDDLRASVDTLVETCIN